MKINVSADPFQTRQINNVSLSLFIAFVMGGVLAAVTLDKRVSDFVTASAAVAMFVTGLYLLFAIKIANQWEKAVVLRLGRLEECAAKDS
jgi:hypothetical protein